ncbi:MAG TPA: universal stress protein [Methanotrichaceae archaeon]|nr:universal stress protein [Methanotrichaceae archaeon]
MFKKILVPIDISERSPRVLDCIRQLPNVKEAVLLNVVVKDPLVKVWEPLAELRNAEARLEELARYLGKAEFSIKTKAEMMPEEGSVSSVIRRVADEENVPLIVMGVGSKSAVEGAMQGSVQGSYLGKVSRDVLCYDDTHLLIIRRRSLDGEKALQEDLCSHIFAKVLLLTDLSEPARAAIFFVAKLRGIKNMVLLHVVPEGGSKEEMDAKAKAATNALNALAEELAGKEGLKVMPPLGVRLSEAALRCRICSKGLDITCHVVVGNIVQEINEMADRENVSLIAMSSIGKSSPSGVQVGRTTYDVANTATKPVLVTRASKVPMLR